MKIYPIITRKINLNTVTAVLQENLNLRFSLSQGTQFVWCVGLNKNKSGICVGICMNVCMYVCMWEGVCVFEHRYLCYCLVKQEF